MERPIPQKPRSLRDLADVIRPPENAKSHNRVFVNRRTGQEIADALDAYADDLEARDRGAE